MFHTQPDGDIGVSVANQAGDGWVHVPGLLFTRLALLQYNVPEEHVVTALRACELAHMANTDQFGTGSKNGKEQWLARSPFQMLEVQW